MKFVSKELAIKLKNKGFDRPCFGYYFIEDKYETNLHKNITCGGDVKNCLRILSDEKRIDAPTIDQVLEWLREENDIDIVIYPIDRNTIYMGGEKYILSICFCGKRDYKIHESNNDKFVKWEDACIAGIKYVINNLI